MKENDNNDIEVKGKKCKWTIVLNLNSYKYSPSEEINGFLKIKPNEDIEINNNIIESFEFQFLFKEKIAYNYTEKNSKIIILEKKLLKFTNYKITDNNTVIIPIKYKLPVADSENFYPSFRYFSNSIKCLITHSISIELPLLSNKTSVNIFIKKIPLQLKENNNNKNNKDLYKTLFGDEIIKNYFSLNKGRLSYFIKTKKSLQYKEKIPVEVHIDESDLGKVKIESITMKIKKHLYIYNDIHIYNHSLETSYNMKKLYLNKSTKNNTIIETLELPENEFTPISLNDIQKINFSNSNFNFTPPVDNILFKCQYCLHITLNFNSKLIKDKIIDIPLDYYDSEYNNKIIKNENEIGNAPINEKDESDDEFNEIFGKENNNNKIKNIGNKNENVQNNENEFIEITKQDFINTIDGKNKNK